MEILLQSFLIFTSLMFWIMFYNKKGLLAEAKKTEKIISEKITVLEDLLDLAKKDSILPLVEACKDADETKEVQEKISSTLVRTLSLEDAKNFSAKGFGSIADFENQEKIIDFEKPSLGVTKRILEARENLKKIDLSEPIRIETFKDVVLMSEKIHSSKK